MQHIKSPSNIIICGSTDKLCQPLNDLISRPDVKYHKGFNPVNGSKILREKNGINVFHIRRYTIIMPIQRPLVDMWIFVTKIELDLFNSASIFKRIETEQAFIIYDSHHE
jgi:hypothetical protein